ncbi:MAG: hypothetical protein DRI95_10535 [Bacteroidetes bacterium]|nr:MAG: hypothetical protein DRI95_10535 [Bacteroidota bacterium]
MTLNNKILQLPSEQLSWLLLIKDIFKRAFKNKDKSDILEAVENKALKKGFKEIGLLLNKHDLEEYFKN